MGGEVEGISSSLVALDVSNECLEEKTAWQLHLWSEYLVRDTGWI